MTPEELNKSVTFLLNDLLKTAGFPKKQIGRLIRKEEECLQFFTFYFTRARFTNCYDLTGALMFSFPEADRLTSLFLGKEYDKLLPAGSKPLYAVVPSRPTLKYKYFSDGSIDRFAEMAANDFMIYALSFYENFNTLNKLQTYFDRLIKERISTEFRVRTGKQGKSSGCYVAATFCVLEKWDKLLLFLKETDLLLDEHRDRINEYISNH